MHLHMDTNESFAGESLVADRTLKRSFTSMLTEVYYKVTILRKTLSAHLTLVLFHFRMRECMLLQQLLAGKVFAAGTTPERLLSGMRPHVYPQILKTADRFAADFANWPRDLALVLSHVSFVGFLVVIHLRADFARVFFLDVTGFVYRQMDLEIIGTLEDLIADFAREPKAAVLALVMRPEIFQVVEGRVAIIALIFRFVGVLASVGF